MEGAERVTARAQPDGMTSEHGLLRSRSACHLVITLRAAEMTKSYPRAPCPRLHPIPCRKGNPILMRTAILTIVLTAAAALTAGCHTNTVDTFAFKSALNTYYASHPDCLWNQPVKFPAQADSSDESQTKGFDALTDAGLLNRTPGEKQRFLIGSKRVNNYDLSDKGRSAGLPIPLSRATVISASARRRSSQLKVTFPVTIRAPRNTASSIATPSRRPHGLTLPK